MVSNNSTINVETKNNREKKDKIEFNTLKIYITIYYTYQLLYCKGRIQMMSNESNINVEKKNDRVKKKTKLHSILWNLQ